MSIKQPITHAKDIEVSKSQRVRSAIRRNPFEYAVITLLVVGTVVRLPHFLIPIWAERPEFHPFRQTQTLTMVREIIRNGPDFSSPLPIFGPPWSVPFEFPIYQNLAGLLSIITGLDEVMASRLVTIFSFQAAGVVLALLAHRLVGPVVALVALSIWQLSQLTWSWSAAPTIEFTAVLFVLLAFLLTVQLTSNRLSPLGLAGLTVLWTLAFLTKLPTAVVWLPFLVAVLTVTLGDPRRTLRSWIGTLTPVAIAGIAGVAFSAHGEAVRASNPFTLFLTNENLTGWFFGTGEQRLDVSNWTHLAMHGNGIAGILILLIVASAVVVIRGTRTEKALAVGGLVSVIGAVSIFFNLYFVHNYYFLAVAPIIALLVGLIGANVYKFVRTRTTPARGLTLVVFFVVAVAGSSWIFSQGKSALSKFVAQEWRYGQSEEIAAATQLGDGIAVVGCSWSPEVLYFADRRGLMLQSDWPPGNLQHQIPREWTGKTIGYVFLCGEGVDVPSLFESPVALTQVSPRLYRVDPQA